LACSVQHQHTYSTCQHSKNCQHWVVGVQVISLPNFENGWTSFPYGSLENSVMWTDIHRSSLLPERPLTVLLLKVQFDGMISWKCVMTAVPLASLWLFLRKFQKLKC
jgi:hypothetical protein